MVSKRSADQPLSARLWGSGFLPSQHQAVLFLNNPAGLSGELHQKMVEQMIEVQPEELLVPEEPEEEKAKAPPPEPPPKVTVLSREARTHLAEKACISDLLAAFLWRGKQPPSEKRRSEWLEKLTAIPCDELPLERRGMPC